MLIYSVIASLDLYTADAEGKFDWAEPDEEVFAFVNDMERGIGTYLYGRRMYETMRSWETLPLEGQSRVMTDFAGIWRAADKVVYSTTLRAASTARTRIESRFDPDAVRELKRHGDVSVGGPGLAASAIRAGLVDEYHLLVTPVVVGGGTSVFPRRGPGRARPGGPAPFRQRGRLPALPLPGLAGAGPARRPELALPRGLGGQWNGEVAQQARPAAPVPRAVAVVPRGRGARDPGLSRRRRCLTSPGSPSCRGWCCSPGPPPPARRSRGAGGSAPAYLIAMLYWMAPEIGPGLVLIGAIFGLHVVAVRRRGPPAAAARRSPGRGRSPRSRGAELPGWSRSGSGPTRASAARGACTARPSGSTRPCSRSPPSAACGWSASRC